MIIKNDLGYSEPMLRISEIVFVVCARQPSPNAREELSLLQPSQYLSDTGYAFKILECDPSVFGV